MAFLTMETWMPYLIAVMVVENLAVFGAMLVALYRRDDSMRVLLFKPYVRFLILFSSGVLARSVVLYFLQPNTASTAWVVVDIVFLNSVMAFLREGFAIFLAHDSVGEEAVSRSLGLGALWGAWNAALGAFTALSADELAPRQADRLLGMPYEYWFTHDIGILLLHSACVARIVFCSHTTYSSTKAVISSHSTASTHDSSVAVFESSHADEAGVVVASHRPRTRAFHSAFFAFAYLFFVSNVFISYRRYERTAAISSLLVQSFFYVFETIAVYAAIRFDAVYWRGGGGGGGGGGGAPRYASLNNDMRRALLANAAAGDDATAAAAANPLIDFSELSLGDVVGVGGAAEVHRGTLRRRGVVAAKVFRVNRLNRETIDAFVREISLSIALKHENIVECLGVCVDVPR